MKRVFPILCAAILTMTMFSCSSERMNDPVGAEVILIPSIDDTSGNDWYDPYHEFTDRDGYKIIGFEPAICCAPYYYTLYSPAGNLKVALAGCSQCGELYGFKIDYDESGMVKDVIRILDRNYNQVGESEGYFDLLVDNDDKISILKRWMNDRTCETEHFLIERDENGQPERIGDIYVPYGYSAKYSIEEWGPFSSSDLDGGQLRFIVLMEEQDKAGRSTVDYLYIDGKLAAELAYWNGVFIKALYYHDGHYDGIDGNRDQNVLWQTYIHDRSSQLETPWYIDRN